MAMKHLSIGKASLVLSVLAILIMATSSSVVYAEDNVLFCMENKDKCTEDGQIITDEKEPFEEQEPADKEPAPQPSTVGLSGWDYIKTGLALVFVVGLLFALLKFVNRKNRIYDKTRFMKNIGGISLGQNKSVQLVVVGETYYLIGVGDDVRLLKEIKDDDEIAALLEFYDQPDQGSPSGMLAQALGKIPKLNPKKMQSNQESTEKSTDFSKVFNSRLDEIKKERKRHISQLTEKERKHDE